MGGGGDDYSKNTNDITGICCSVKLNSTLNGAKDNQKRGGERGYCVFSFEHFNKEVGREIS